MQRQLSESHASSSLLLEQVLHSMARFSEHALLPSSGGSFKRGPESAIGRQVARTLRRPSVQVTKYFSYYLPSSDDREETSQNGRGNLPCPTSARKQLAKLLQSNQRFKKAGEAPQTFLHVLQTLRKSGVVITSQFLKRLCKLFQISPVYIAKLTSFFPEYALSVDLQASYDTTSAETENPVTDFEDRESTHDQPVALTFKPSAMSLSNCLWNLADQQQLAEDRYVRHIASRLHVPTCRLSKLRRYYRWNNEQTD